MTLVDSCGWLEYFTDGPLVDKYYKYLVKPQEIIVPTIVLYEVYKKIKKETTEEYALLAIAQMQSSIIVQLKESIALSAADISLQYALPMADAIVYATARHENALLATSDEHFRGLEAVNFIEK